MNDFRAELAELVEQVVAAGLTPVFMVIDLEGASDVRRTQGDESYDRFVTAVTGAVRSAGPGSEALRYNDSRFVAIMPGFSRGRTFAIADKLGRSLPYIAQSFDCTLVPEFDIVEYDAAGGMAAFMHHLVARRDEPAA